MSIGAWDKTVGQWSDEESRRDRSSKRWNFSYWTFPFGKKSEQGQRLAFWDDSLAECGVVLFAPGKTVPYSRIVDLMHNLTAKPSLRSKYTRPLSFPLQDNYPTFGDFAEEAQSLEHPPK